MSSSWKPAIAEREEGRVEIEEEVGTGIEARAKAARAGLMDEDVEVTGLREVELR
jgi:hypothetical protein